MFIDQHWHLYEMCIHLLSHQIFISKHWHLHEVHKPTYHGICVAVGWSFQNEDNRECNVCFLISSLSGKAL